MKTHITSEEAESVLPEGDMIHVFMNPAPNVITGADWERASIIDAINRGSPEFAGKMATSMGHGIACAKMGIWIQTDAEKLKALESKYERQQ